MKNLFKKNLNGFSINSRNYKLIKRKKLIFKALKRLKNISLVRQYN